MSYRWVIDDANPNGHLVELTPEEEAQRVADQQAGAASADARAVLDGNHATIVAALLAGMATADTHITNISAASPTPAEQKAALLFSLRASKQLARLALNLYDGTT